MFSRRKDSAAVGKVIGNPVLTQTSADLNKMGNRYIEPQPPALPPKDNIRRKQPATVTGAVKRKPYAPLNIDFEAIKRGGPPPIPKSNEPPSPVSPLSVMSGRRKHNDTAITPPGSAGDPYSSQTGKEFIAGPRYNNARAVSGPMSNNPPAQTMPRNPDSFTSRARQYADRAGTGLDNWIRAQREKDNTEPPAPPPASAKPPSPRARVTSNPIPAPKLKLRQSTFQPLRNSLQDVQHLTEPLPPIPALDQPKYKMPRKKKVVPLPLTAIPQQHAPQAPPKDDPEPKSEPLDSEKLYDELYKTLGKTTKLPSRISSRRNTSGPRDHIDDLQLEQKDLEDRKMEIRGAIYRLEQAIPPYSTTGNSKARKMLQERLDELKTELAGCDRELHEVGMNIYRAMRRRNKEEGVERPTHIWVNRVCD